MLERRHVKAPGFADVAHTIIMQAAKNQTVCLGTAGCEDDLLRFGVDTAGNLFPCVFHGHMRLSPEAVQCSGVAVFLREIRHHRAQHFRIDFRGRRVVKIDRGNPSLIPGILCDPHVPAFLLLILLRLGYVAECLTL